MPLRDVRDQSPGLPMRADHVVLYLMLTAVATGSTPSQAALIN